MACSLLFTVFPLLPLFNWPRLNLCMAFSTIFWNFGLSFVIFLMVRRDCSCIIPWLMINSRGLRRGIVMNGRTVLCEAYATFRPLISCIITTTTAITSRMWISPPIVYEETIPNSQSASKITAIVYNICLLLLLMQHFKNLNLFLNRSFVSRIMLLCHFGSWPC